MATPLNQDADRIYVEEYKLVTPFRFDEAVAQVFDNMISRSVPGYATTLELINSTAALYAQPGTCCYDLGCSLGAATVAMANALPEHCRIVAVDNSAAMVERCTANIGEYQRQYDQPRTEIDVIEADLSHIDFQPASIIVMNYTLQFIPSEHRADLIAKLAAALVSGGCLLISEKVHFNDAATTEHMRKLHENYKRQQGYSDLEIAQKRTALENVLVTDTESTHHERFKAVGLTSDLIARHLNFVTLLATKPSDSNEG